MTYPSGHENPGVAAVIFYLEEWLVAMENGVAHLRQPDPAYPRQYTEEELDTLVRDIDAEIDQEVVRAPGNAVGAKAGPKYVRLALPQRLAMAQGLHALCSQYGLQEAASDV